MDPHRRRLPHQYPEGRPLFVTFHLYGSLPHALYPPPHKQSAGQAFVWMDRYLDTTTEGPLYLEQEPVASMVESSVLYGAQQTKNYNIHAYVIMANHVHLLLLPPNTAESPVTDLERLHGSGGEQVAWTHRKAFLATRVLRPLGARRGGRPAD